jgi:GNAT superfamily N-acetyltransferase
MDLRVELVPAELTLPLRRQVLRPTQPIRDSVFPNENAPGAVHVAARTADGEVVGTAVLVREQCAALPDRADAWRLRGLAVPDGLRGRGVGGRVLRYALGQVALHGGGLVWANVRDGARGFYAGQGFAETGEPWTAPAPDPDDGRYTGPYVVMWRDVHVPVD